MIKKIRVGNQIHPAIREQTAHMFLQLLTIHKRIMQLIYQFSFFIGQAIWIFGIYGWEVGITQDIFFSLVHKDTTVEVYLL